MRYLLVVAAVLAVGCEDKMAQAKKKVAEIEMHQIVNYLENYAIVHRRIPYVLGEAVMTGRDGHLTLKENDPGQLGYGRRPMDPWDRAWRYEAKPDEGTYKLASAGPDGVDGTPDDVATTGHVAR